MALLKRQLPLLDDVRIKTLEAMDDIIAGD